MLAVPGFVVCASCSRRHGSFAKRSHDDMATDQDHRRTVAELMQTVELQAERIHALEIALKAAARAAILRTRVVAALAGRLRS